MRCDRRRGFYIRRESFGWRLRRGGVHLPRDPASARARVTRSILRRHRAATPSLGAILCLCRCENTDRRACEVRRGVSICSHRILDHECGGRVRRRVVPTPCRSQRARRVLRRAWSAPCQGHRRTTARVSSPYEGSRRAATSGRGNRLEHDFVFFDESSRRHEESGLAHDAEGQGANLRKGESLVWFEPRENLVLKHFGNPQAQTAEEG